MVRRPDISKTVYDIYKYFRAYEILGKGTPFSQNWLYLYEIIGQHCGLVGYVKTMFNKIKII